MNNIQPKNIQNLLTLAHTDRKYQEAMRARYKKWHSIMSFKELLYTNIENIIKTYDAE